MTDGHPHDLRLDDPREADYHEWLWSERTQELLEDLQAEKEPQQEESHDGRD